MLLSSFEVCTGGTHSHLYVGSCVIESPFKGLMPQSRYALKVDMKKKDKEKI